MLAVFVDSFQSFFTIDRVQVAIRVIIILVIGFVLIRLITTASGKIAQKYLSQQHGLLFKKAIFYTGVVLILIICLQQMGFKLTALLGAAGIAGIAIGFASQTSVSNVISGLFLISEKPFQVGDVIKIGEAAGTVLSIDLLSVKIKTFNNQFIRIPNEKLLGTELTNITRFPIRRLDINISASFKSDIALVMELLADVAGRNPYCLDNPAPTIMFNNFGASALEFFFGVWYYKTDYGQLKNSIMREIKERFDKAGIEIPFPHRTISTTEPVQVAIVHHPDQPR